MTNDLDAADYRAIMDTRGRNPAEFSLAASPADPAEGELGPSNRTVTVTHMPTGIARTYAFRTWLGDLNADLEEGVFDRPLG